MLNIGNCFPHHMHCGCILAFYAIFITTKLHLLRWRFLKLNQSIKGPVGLNTLLNPYHNTALLGIIAAGVSATEALGHLQILCWLRFAVLNVSIRSAALRSKVIESVGMVQFPRSPLLLLGICRYNVDLDLTTHLGESEGTLRERFSFRREKHLCYYTCRCHTK